MKMIYLTLTKRFYMYRRKSPVGWTRSPLCRFFASILCWKHNSVTSCWWRNDLRHDPNMMRVFHVSDAPLASDASGCDIDVSAAGVARWQQDCTETRTDTLLRVSLQPCRYAGLSSPKHASLPCVYHYRLPGLWTSIPTCTNISGLLSRTSHLRVTCNNT
jgi:hypothetical protein